MASDEATARLGGQIDIGPFRSGAKLGVRVITLPPFGWGAVRMGLSRLGGETRPVSMRVLWRRNGKRLGRPPGAPCLPHLPVGGLNIPCEAFGIKQRVGPFVSRKPGA